MQQGPTPTLRTMDPSPVFSTPLSNFKSPLLCSTIDPVIIPFYFHHHHRMIPSLPRPPSLPLQPTFHPPKIISSAVLGGGNGRRRGKRRRRKTLGSAGMSALRQAFSFAASFRRLWSPADPLDMLIIFQNNGGGGGGGGGGWRGFWSGGEGWPERRMPWKEGGLVGLLVSLAVTAAASVLERTGEKDLGIGVLVPRLLGLKRRRIWRREVGVLILGFAFCLLFWKVVGRRRRNGRRWIASFARRF